MSLWKRSMEFLGLGPDEIYDDYKAYDESVAPTEFSRQTESERGEPDGGPGDDNPIARTVGQRPSFPSKDFEVSSAMRRPGSPAAGPSSRGNDNSGVQIRPSSPESSPGQPQLRSIPGGAMEPHTVRPRRFDQAQEVADAFKSGTPVIMNLEGSEREVARRLVDFASGICYALDGTMEKVATGVYLLKPIGRRKDSYDN